MERPSFSPFWHKVAATRPRLRSHVQITRQHYRRGRWHVAHDPATNQFYRLNPVAYDFVASLDGSRTVDEAWKHALEKHGDGAPTQNEIIELISQLYRSNLLSIDIAPEVEQLLKRAKERTARKVKQQLIGLMYFRLPLVNPDAFLSAVEPIFRPLLNRWGFIAWLALVVYALAKVLPEWRALASGFEGLSNPANWLWIAGTFVVLKLWHELGHGVICRRFGGQVPEAGVMLLVLFPSPYVDASSAWGFDSKWKRMAVGAGGMMFELTAAAIAGLVWLSAAEGTLLREVMYFAMISSSVSTVFFNANPLMRFDGYFIFSDLVEVPNLMNRSMLMLRYWAVTILYRVKNTRPPSRDKGEMALLGIYGVASMLYRVLLFALIVFFLLGQFFVIGVILALWSVAVWFAGPMIALTRWHATSSMLHDRRGRALVTTAALAALGVVLVGMVPVPDWRRATGVVEAYNRAGAFAATEGFVERVHVRAGEAVRKDDPIVTLANPELKAMLDYAVAQEQVLLAGHREALADNDPASAQAAARQAEVWRQQAAEHRRRMGELVVRAPIDGVIVSHDPGLTAGVHVRAGEAICEVADPRRVRVAATLSQTEGQWMYELPREEFAVRMRPVGDVWRVIEATDARVLPAAQRVLPHAALGMVGGGDVMTMPEDRSGRGALKEQFTMYVEVPPTEMASLTPGQRVHLRVSLPAKPLLSQIIDRLNKALQGRVNL